MIVRTKLGMIINLGNISFWSHILHDIEYLLVDDTASEILERGAQAELA